MKRIGTISYRKSWFIVANFIFFLLFMRIFSGEKLRASLEFPTILIGSDALFNRMQFIIIALAPAVILGIILLWLLFCIPEGYQLLPFAGSAPHIRSCRFRRRFPSGLLCLKISF